jgi:hypothetical protein
MRGGLESLRADFENEFPPSSIQGTHFQVRLESTPIMYRSTFIKQIPYKRKGDEHVTGSRSKRTE